MSLSGESIHHVNPVSRVIGEGAAEFFRTWGPDFDEEEV